MTSTDVVVGEFFVPGRARTKGSLNPIVSRGPGGKLIVSMVESVADSKPWRLKIIKTICEQNGWALPKIIRQRGKEPRYVFDHEPFAGAIEVRFMVRFAREFVVLDGVTTEEWREASSGAWPISIIWGDGDKLERNLWDALTQSGLIEDDRLVVTWEGRKRFCREGQRQGLWCRIIAAPDVPDDDADDDWLLGR